MARFCSGSLVNGFTRSPPPPVDDLTAFCLCCAIGLRAPGPPIRAFRPEDTSQHDRIQPPPPTRVHPHRAAGRHRHHRSAHRHPASGAGQGPRERQGRQVPRRHPPDGHRHEHLRQRPTRLVPRPAHPRQLPVHRQDRRPVGLRRGSPSSSATSPASRPCSVPPTRRTTTTGAPRTGSTPSTRTASKRPRKPPAASPTSSPTTSATCTSSASR